MEREAFLFHLLREFKGFFPAQDGGLPGPFDARGRTKERAAGKKISDDCH
jgi:hypothetical protein